jgi:hypothetical protein
MFGGWSDIGAARATTAPDGDGTDVAASCRTWSTAH